jgi:plasmid stabilization system protein ParE
VDDLLKHDVRGAASRIQAIIRAVDVLEHNPLIGRAVENGKRELIIGRDSRGYIALYVYAAGIDTVFVLALRAQVEAGYVRE